MQNVKLNSFDVSDVFFLCALVSFLKCNLQVNRFLSKSEKKNNAYLLGRFHLPTENRSTHPLVLT